MCCNSYTKTTHLAYLLRIGWLSDAYLRNMARVSDGYLLCTPGGHLGLATSTAGRLRMESVIPVVRPGQSFPNLTCCGIAANLGSITVPCEVPAGGEGLANANLGTPPLTGPRVATTDPASRATQGGPLRPTAIPRPSGGDGRANLSRVADARHGTSRTGATPPVATSAVVGLTSLVARTNRAGAGGPASRRGQGPPASCFIPPRRGAGGGRLRRTQRRRGLPQEAQLGHLALMDRRVVQGHGGAGTSEPHAHSLRNLPPLGQGVAKCPACLCRGVGWCPPGWTSQPALPGRMPA
jgi:hypothetical protein